MNRYYRYFPIRNETSFPIPEYSVVFSFEKVRNFELLNDFVEDHMYVAFTISILYLCTIFWLKRWMRDRPAYSLKYFAIPCNSFIFTMNTLAALRLTPFFATNLWHLGFYSSVCVVPSVVINDPVFLFWVSIFPYMKIVELADTFLIVLQKRDLAVYYWTHHFGALLCTWYLYPFKMPILAWFAILISATHIPIYLYLTLKAIGLTLPKSYLTGVMVTEVVHMAYGTILCLYAYYLLMIDTFCSTSTSNVLLCMFMYIYCLLQSAFLLYLRLMKEPCQTQFEDQKRSKLPNGLKSSNKCD